jgi:2-dehydro-3-deoxy-D-arabinonate dehydratase
MSHEPFGSASDPILTVVSSVSAEAEAVGGVTLWRLADGIGREHLVVVARGSAWDLSKHLSDPPLASLLRLPLDRIREHVATDRSEPLPWPPPDWRSLKPIDRQEVWAAGVTYQRSRDARIEESRESGDIYTRVYGSERPELFFKATPDRTVGDGETVLIRSDSEWNVPEPELAVVLNRHLDIVGYSVGNDVSSRTLEGENPLYLPQAKIYRGSCGLGPCIVVDESLAVRSGLEITLAVHRDGAVAFSGATNTRLLRVGIDTLVEYLGRDNSFPDGVVLLTGTGVVPPADFSLQPGDVVDIFIEGVGKLTNPVRTGTGSVHVEGDA